MNILNLNLFHRKFRSLYLVLGAFAFLFFFFSSASDVKAATANNPTCSGYSTQSLPIGAAYSRYLDVGYNATIQIIGGTALPNGSYSTATLSGFNAGVANISTPSYTTPSGTVDMLHNFTINGVSVGTTNVTVDYIVYNASNASICWSQNTYAVQVTNLPTPDYSVNIAPVTSNVVQGNKATYSVNIICNRSFNVANTISTFVLNPGALVNISHNFSDSNVTCGGYTILTIGTTTSTSPVSTPGAPNTQNFEVEAVAAAYSMSRNGGALINVYGMPQVVVTPTKTQVVQNDSVNVAWSSTYTDNSVNGGFPCEFSQNGTLIGNRLPNGAPPGEFMGALTMLQMYQYEFACTGYGGVRGFGNAYVYVTTSSNNIIVGWSLNGVPQTGFLPNIDFDVMHRKIDGSNCSGATVWCNDATNPGFAPWQAQLTDNLEYRVTYKGGSSPYWFMGITPPGEQVSQVTPPYSSTILDLAVGQKIAFVLNFSDQSLCPDFTIPPYSSYTHYPQMVSSTSVPPASLRNVNVGDAATVTPDPQYSGGTFGNSTSGSGGKGTYTVVNGNKVWAQTYGNGAVNTLVSNADWEFDDPILNNHGTNCRMGSPQFQINDHAYNVSTISQSKNQGDTAIYSMSSASQNSFQNAIGYSVVSGNLPAGVYITYCDNSNNCATSQTITPTMSGTSFGYIKIGTDLSTPVGTYTFTVRARYPGNYQNNDKNSTSLTLIVSNPVPAPVVSISAPLVATSINYSASTTVTWSATDTNTNGCTVTSSLAGHGPWNSQPASGSINDINVTADSTYTVTCAGPGGSGDSNRSVTVNPNSPSNIKTYNSNTDLVTNPVPCGQIKVSWDVVSGAQGYYIYTTPAGASIQTVVGGPVSSSFYTTSSTNTYYVAAYADYGSGIKTSPRVVVTPPPSQPISPVPSPCPPNFSNSDLDVTLVDNAAVNTPDNCGGIPDNVNGPRDYVIGTIVKYKINICNGGPPATDQVKAVMNLSNLSEPTAGWNFQVFCGGCANQSSPIPTGVGSPSDPFVWDFGVASLAGGSNWYITFDGQTSLPPGSNQSDFYAYVYGDIKVSNVTVKSISSNFVHFRYGLEPDIREVMN